MKTVTFNVVRVDETDHWRERFQQYGPIWGYYFLDPNQATYACELTPSRYLYFMNDRNEQEAPEYIQEEIDDASRSRDDHGIYVHCNQADRLEVRQSDTFEIEDDEDYMLAVEQALEYYSGNSPR